MVRVTFKDVYLHQYTLEVSESDTIAAVKNSISPTLNILPSEQKLVHQGRELLDHELVSDCLSHDSIVYVFVTNNPAEISNVNPLQTFLSDDSLFKMTLKSNSYLKNICQDNPEISRAVNDLMSDPQTLIQAAKAATNPAMARELARATDRAVQNVEAIPGGFQALYNLHNKLQDPLWNAAASSFNDESPIKAKVYNDDRLAPLEAHPLPNPWKQLTGFGLETPSQGSRLPHGQPSVPNQVTPRLPLLNYTDSFYRQQADLLVQMGFTDHAKCLAAIEQAQGDISIAIDILTRPDSSSS